ncbi:MAG: hypothetical protein ACI3XM_06895, partial [Eubacteriales bacterium]
MKSNITRTFFVKNSLSVRILVSVCVFLLAALTAYACVFPVFAHQSLRTLDAQAPLAVPAAVITNTDGSDMLLSDEAVQALAEIGTVIRGTVGNTYTANGIRLRLYGLSRTYLSEAVMLSEGRMPQNETECIAVSCGAGGEALCEIGSAVRICGDDGEAFSVMTVVGIGVNALSVCAPLTGDDRQALLYTTSDAAWADAVYAQDAIFLLTASGTEADTIADRISDVRTRTADAQQKAYRAVKEAALEQAKLRAEEAAAAVSAQEIAVQNAKNRCETALLRVSEAEGSLLAALGALETERQQFYSDMETYEYYATNQTSLIPRRDLAEESFTAQEEEIAVLTLLLDDAYAARDEADSALAGQTERLTVLRNELTDAQAALQTADSALQDIHVPEWESTLRSEEAGYAALSASAAAQRTAYLIYAAVLLLPTLLLFLPASRMGVFTADVSSGILSAVLPVPALCLAGVICGGCILPAVGFGYRFPQCAETMKAFSCFVRLYPSCLYVSLLLFLALGILFSVIFRMCTVARPYRRPS